uniref:Nuclear transport factor 2 n=1 Tax=Aureoumbra lagunensis TaxID=44058 RepID=A0A7S3NPH7_9STRA|mmetsp:Transcript_7064/g.8493  ORF Transcript_7064/g.8493 Transcript_7064/m.8493 type:complete len:122 (+) Transcript_7064:38-403(+)
MSAEEVAKAFVPHYYQCFDGAREQLVGLYRDQSLLTFEGDGPKQGPQQIMDKLRALPVVVHNIQTIEVQPSVTPNAILIFVTGQIMIEQDKPLKYTQLFQLVGEGPGQYYLHNDIFRFNYS